MEKTDRPIVELLRLAGPTVAQMASYTVMQFLDTWMLSHVGDRITPPTAAANSGILAFAVISLGMGVLWVVNALVSQCFGRKDDAGCGEFLWQGVWFAIIFSAIILPFLSFSGVLFRVLGHEANLARLEAVYLQIVVSFCAIKLIGTAFSQFLLAINRAAWVMIATIFGVAVNAVAGWILIFGALGLRSHGVIGAAWAQNIGVGVETLGMIAFSLLPVIRRKFNVLDWRFRWSQMRMLLKIGIPSGIQIVAEVLAWSMFINVVMSSFGTPGMAANNFVFRYMAVSFMPAFGIGIAVTALVGRYIGRGEPDVAMSRAHLGFFVSMIYMVFCGAMFFIFRRELIGRFTDDPRVLAIGATVLCFAAVYQLFDAMYLIYSSALRGAGDTLTPAIVTAVLCWTLTVGGGYWVASHFPRLGPAGPWLMATAYGVILGIFMLTRFSRGKWRRIHLERPANSNVENHSTTVLRVETS